ERVASLQHKLDASEAARRRAEGQLQQALAALAQPGRRSRMPVPTVIPVSQDVVKVPEPDPIVAKPEPEPVRVARPEPAPARRRQPRPKQQRARRSKPRPVAVPAPKPTMPEPVVETPQPEPVVETPQPEPAPIVPPSEPVPPPEPITTPEAEPVPVAKVEPTDATARPEVVVVPELRPARTSVGRESASDLLDRLVEPVAEHGSTDAPSDLRAKLARTAPGSTGSRRPVASWAPMVPRSCCSSRHTRRRSMRRVPRNAARPRTSPRRSSARTAWRRPGPRPPGPDRPVSYVTGTRPPTVEPSPGTLRIVSEPPIASSRSAIPWMPVPPRARSTWNPAPSSSTSNER